MTANPKRKHRLTIDITFNQKLTKRLATKALNQLLLEVDKGRPIYISDPQLYCDKLVAVEK